VGGGGGLVEGLGGFGGVVCGGGGEGFVWWGLGGVGGLVSWSTNWRREGVGRERAAWEKTRSSEDSEEMPENGVPFLRPGGKEGEKRNGGTDGGGAILPQLVDPRWEKSDLPPSKSRIIAFQSRGGEEKTGSGQGKGSRRKIGVGGKEGKIAEKGTTVERVHRGDGKGIEIKTDCQQEKEKGEGRFERKGST